MPVQYAFYLDTDRCVQCHACEVACKSWNGVELGVRWRRVLDAWSGQFPMAGNWTVSYSCMHCATPACVDVCPRKAITKRSEDGIVVVDPGKCVGCRSCLKACPFHIPSYGSSGAMQKCDMCLERVTQGKEPACVATCPGEALRFGTVEQLRKRAASRKSEIVSASTAPSFFLVGRVRAEDFINLLGTRAATDRS